jgi:putative glutamine amidotransferase
VTPLIAVPGRLRPRSETSRTATVGIGQPYLQALRRAGGEGVVVLPDRGLVDRLPKLLARFDGLLLTGGGDVDPRRYGATTVHDEVAGIDVDHDAFELAAFRTAVDLDLPVLAICRGCQIVAVAQGGTLDQHITDDEVDVQHRGHLHEVEVEEGSRLAAAVGARSLSVSSRHHQAVADVGRGLRVTARASDGVVEGVEFPDRWVVGVQWHPEDTAADDPAQQGLFDAFVAACARARAAEA